MTGDLGARLEAALGAQEQRDHDLQPDPQVLAAVHAQVRRRRTVRAVQRTAVAAVAVVAVAVAGWAGLRTDPPQPAITPTPAPSVTSTPTPSPTPQVTESPEPEPAAVELPGHPPMLELPEGVLESAGPGWFLLTYGSGMYGSRPDRDLEFLGQTLALSAPTGELYFVGELDSSVQLIRWAAGSSTVRVVVWDEGSSGHSVPADLDVATGQIVIDDRLSDGATWVGTTADGEEIWVAAMAGTSDRGLYILPVDGAARAAGRSPGVLDVKLAPDGRHVVGTTWNHSTSENGTVVASETAVVVVDVESGEETAVQLPGGQNCNVVAWLDSSSLLSRCRDSTTLTDEDQRFEDLGGQIVRLDATGGAPQVLAVLGSGDIVPSTGHWVRDGVVVFSGTQLTAAYADCQDLCYRGAFVWSGGAAEPLSTDVELPDGICRADVGGSDLLVWTGAGSCFEELDRGQLWTVALDTGATRLVGPAVSSPSVINVRWAVEAGS